MIIAFLLFSLNVLADNKPPLTLPAKVETATVELEWESVPEASSYDVELAPLDKGPAISFSTKESKFSKQVPVGTYILRMRSQDKVNGEYGAWSKPVTVEAIHKLVNLLKPEDKSEMKSPKEKRMDVLFEWSGLPNGREYILRLWADDAKDAVEFHTGKNSKQLNLLTAKVYRWQVIFKTGTPVDYQSEPTVFTFTLTGPQLLKPIVDPKISLPYVKELSWTTSPGADHYDVKLLHHALDEVDWQPCKKSDQKLTKYTFETLPPGMYRVEVTALGLNRLSSEVGFYEFLVKPTEQDLLKALKSARLTPQETHK